MKKIVSEEAAFEKTLILTGQLFSSLSPRFFYYLTLLRKNRRPVLIDIIFNVHWGILGAIVSLKLIPSFGFKSIFVPKSWLSCFGGTATYEKKNYEKPINLQCTRLVNHLSSKAELSHRNPTKAVVTKMHHKDLEMHANPTTNKTLLTTLENSVPECPICRIDQILNNSMCVQLYMYTWQMDHWVQRCLIQLGSGPSRLVRYNQQVFTFHCNKNVSLPSLCCQISTDLYCFWLSSALYSFQN